MTTFVEQIHDPLQFQKIVLPYLCSEEAKNCLPIGIIDTLINHPETFKKFYLWLVKDENTVLGLAWLTPPFPLGITAIPSKSFEELMDKIELLGEEISSIFGPRPVIDQFIEAWTVRFNQKVESSMEQRIYELTKIGVQPGPGIIALASENHIDLLEKWSKQFIIDCGLHDDIGNVRDSVLKAIHARSRYLWFVNDEPVAMAGVSGRTPSGIRINWVYTPNSLRGKGYATSLVASLSQKLLSEGMKLCFLFTDLANQTSNSIYQRIGYCQVGDAVTYRLTSQKKPN